MHRMREGKGGRHLEGHTDILLKSNFKKLVTHLCTLSTRSSNKISKKSGKSKLEQNSSIVHKSYIFDTPPPPPKKKQKKQKKKKKKLHRSVLF